MIDAHSQSFLRAASAAAAVQRRDSAERSP